MINLLLNTADFARALADDLLSHLGGSVTDAPAAPTCLAGARPHQAQDGMLLCRHHFAQLGEWLHDVEREARHLDYDPDNPDAWALLPSMEARHDSGGGTLASQRAPARLDPIVLSDPRTSTWGARLPGPYCLHCRHTSCAVRRGADEDRDAGSADAINLLDTLRNAVDRVREGRMLTPPPVEDRFMRWDDGPQYVVRCATRCTHPWCWSVGVWVTIPAPTTIRTDRELLTRHLDWIAQQPWVGQFRTDVRKLRAALQRLNGTSDPRPLPGRCPALIDGTECGGPLWPAKPKHTSGEDAWTGSSPSAVQCGACTGRWEGPAALARLALILDQQQRKDAS